MLYRILADAVVGIHFLFIVFVLSGGLLVFRWPRMAWLHVPAFLWGGLIVIGGWICPLTYVENYFRMKGAAEGYAGGFMERYLLPLIYPELLFPGGLFPGIFIAIGCFVLVVNGLIYWRVWARRRAHKSSSSRP
ncbi:MAG: DUF2784 domain-containing protein [Alphaproteobacteria bacterium]